MSKTLCITKEQLDSWVDDSIQEHDCEYRKFREQFDRLENWKPKKEEPVRLKAIPKDGPFWVLGDESDKCRSTSGDYYIVDKDGVPIGWRWVDELIPEEENEH